MPQHIHKGVRDRRDSPTQNEEVTLIVGVEESTSDQTSQWIEDIGGEVEERLPYDYLAVSIAEQELENLCSIETITSVEIEGSSESLESEDFQSRTDMIL